MPQSRAQLCFSAEQVAAFRLERHHLLQRKQASLASICSNVCGIQAQVMSAAEVALGIRSMGHTREDVHRALWQTRTLVKTSCMRMTLHLIPASEFSLYIAALKQSRTAAILGLLNRRLRVTPAEVAKMNQVAVEALSEGPLTQRELVEKAKKKAGERLKIWLEQAWGATWVRPAIIEGLLCYGPPRGTEVTLVRVDQWLPKQPRIEEDAAKRELLRRYLAAYGPATVRDFSKWSGMPPSESKGIWESMADEMEQVSVAGAPAWILRSDVDSLAHSELDKDNVRLLPSFDPLLLAHKTKDHLVEPRYYKRVYRTLGRICPVVLLGGKVVGVWLTKRNGKSTEIEIRPFRPLPRTVRARIAEEAGAIGDVLGTRGEVRFSS